MISLFRRDNWSRWTLIFSANLALLIVLLEIALRIIPIPGFTNYIQAIRILSGQREGQMHDPDGNMGVFIPNRTFSWTIMDGTFDVTTVPFLDKASLGLRDDGLDLSAPTKVFACGDSFTFGYGVDDENVWHEILERKYEGSVDIFSLRGIGASIRNIHAKYPRYKDRFPHDTVFLGIYTGNEFMEAGQGRVVDPDRRDSPQLEDLGYQTEPSTRGFGGRLYNLVRRHSYTARLGKFLMFRNLVRIGYYNYDVNREVYQPEGSPFVFTIDYEEDILVRTCEIEYSSTMAGGVVAFEKYLDELVQLIRTDGRQIYAFVFPFKEQVYWEHWVSRLDHPEDYDRLKPNKIVANALEQSGVDYYDLTYAMIDAGREQELYWPIDSHWNEAGNQAASDLIHHWLESRGFPKRAGL